MPSMLRSRRHSPSRTRQRLGSVAAVFGGGVLGSLAREAAALLLPRQPGDFPTAVLVVNLVGAFMLGWFLARRERAVSPMFSTAFWAIGVFGSFTTFSAFSVDTFDLIEAGAPELAAAFVAASVLGGLALGLVGQRLGGAM